MKTLAVTLASAAAAFAALSYSNTAHALGPIDIEIAGRVGYATAPSGVTPNPYGLGLGGRAGVSFFGIYGGISGMYYLGSSANTGNGSVSATAAMEGFEVGYTLPIPFVKIRPQIGIGNATFAESGFSESNLYLEPGALVFVPFLKYLFVGADVNALILPGDTVATPEGPSTSKTEVSLSVHGQFGVRF